MEEVNCLVFAQHNLLTGPAEDTIAHVRRQPTTNNLII